MLTEIMFFEFLSFPNYFHFFHFILIRKQISLISVSIQYQNFTFHFFPLWHFLCQTTARLTSKQPFQLPLPAKLHPITSAIQEQKISNKNKNKKKVGVCTPACVHANQNKSACQRSCFLILCLTCSMYHRIFYIPFIYLSLFSYSQSVFFLFLFVFVFHEQPRVKRATSKRRRWTGKFS